MKITFKEKLILILILMGLLPLMAIAIFQIQLFSSYLENITFSSLEKISDISSFKIESFINNYITKVKIISKNEILTSKETSKNEKLEEIKKINVYYDVFENVTILDKNGEIVVSSSENLHEKWKEKSSFLKVKEKKTLIVSDMYFVSEKENPKIDFLNPILDKNNEIKYLIAAQANASPLLNSLNYNIGNLGGLILTNDQEKVLFHSRKEPFFGKVPIVSFLENIYENKINYTYFNFFGEKQVAGFKIIENEKFDFKWHLITYQPEKEAFGILNDMNRFVVVLSLFFLATILLVSLFLSRKISEPIKKLSLASKEISKENFDLQLNVLSNDEFGELAKTFNKMTEKLKKNKEKMEEEKQVLEIKVKARTRELENMNKDLENKIKKRTKEMEEKLKELEKMNKLMSGRELKMIELKKKIKKYEKENNNKENSN